MTDEELVKRLRNAKATQDFRHTLEDEAADRIEALTKERNALRSALNRIRPIPERILRGIPVRDLAETLAEADSALIKGESHE
jgi:hypothetical protein